VRSTPSLAKASPVVARPAAELVRPWSIVERLVARQALVTPEGASQQTPWLPDVTVHSMWRAVKVLSNPAAGSPVD
jgi:hypothetical protein